MKRVEFYVFHLDLYQKGKRWDKVSVSKGYVKSVFSEDLPDVKLKEVNIPDSETYIVYSRPFNEPESFIKDFVKLWLEHHHYKYKNICNVFDMLDFVKQEILSAKQ